MGKISINAKIHKDKFSIMNADLKTKSAPASTVSTSILMNKLRSVAAYCPDQISKLFEGEIFGVAQSLAEDKTSFYHGTKLEIKKRLPKCLPPVIDMQTSAIIIELSPVVFRQAGKPAANNFNRSADLLSYNGCCTILSKN